MAARPSLEKHMKRMALGWAMAGLALTVGIASSLGYILPFRDTENQIKAFAQSTTASRRNDILSGDVRATELQIQKDLNLTEGEQAWFLDPDKNRWLKDVRQVQLVPCEQSSGICHKHFGRRVVSYTPIYFDAQKKTKWGYLYIERQPQANWTLIFWITIAVVLGMCLQAAGFYIGLTRSMTTVGKTLSQWAMALSVSPKNRNNYQVAPYSEIAPVELALNRLRTEIDQLEEIARNEGALSTLRSVGHDILNPVARLKRILGLAEPIGENGFTIDHDLFRGLHANTNRLSCYAEQLKFIYKRKIGDVEDVGSLIDVSVELLKLAGEMRFDPAAQDKKIAIEAHIENRSYVAMPQADFGRLLENLISNAIHASRPGQCIKVASRQSADSAIISVSDQGHGMNDQVCKKIFEAGFTLNPNQGTGLGLFVVKHILDQYGGRISIDSKVGEGTLMTIDLPRVEVSHELQNFAR